MRIRPRTSPLAAIVAAVLVLTGVQAASHRHAPKADGWHETGPRGDRAHDEDRDSCSMCRLAHESQTAPATPGTASVPMPQAASAAEISSAPATTAPAREHSPRAPPCIASC